MSFTITADPGSYALSGADAALRRRYKKTGSYAVVGQETLLAYGYRLAAAAGSFSLTGTALSFVYGKAIVAGPGSYLISGTPVAFVRVTAEQSVVFEFDKWNPYISRAA